MNTNYNDNTSDYYCYYRDLDYDLPPSEFDTGLLEYTVNHDDGESPSHMSRDIYTTNLL